VLISSSNRGKTRNPPQRHQPKKETPEKINTKPHTMKHKKLLTIAAGAIAASLAVSAQAQTDISFEFTGVPGPYNNYETLAPTDVAGVIPAANWNVVDISQFTGYAATLPLETDTLTSGVVDSNGLPSSVGASLTSYGTVDQKYAGDNIAGTAGVLLNSGGMTNGAGGVYPTPATLTISGLNSGDNYEFFVYTSGQAYGTAYASVGLAGVGTQYFQTAQGNATGFQTNSTTSDLMDGVYTAGAYNYLIPYTYESNYVEFSGVTGLSSANFTLTELGSYPNGCWCPAGYLSGNNSGNAQVGIAGIQVVDLSAAVPEPATIWSAALGLIGLVGFQVRRSRKS
jgi:hypothetical protein